MFAGFLSKLKKAVIAHAANRDAKTQAIVNKLTAGIDNDEGVTVSQIVMLGLGIIVLAYTLPVAFNAFYAAETGNWTINGSEDTKTTAMWYLIPFVIIIGVIYIYLKE